ncbi:hypothetical protein ACMFMG_010744 [Clarireedia jacksonii]
MAVLHGVPGLEAVVCVEGNVSREFEPTVSDSRNISKDPNEPGKGEKATSSLGASNITTKYIEAKTDESFSCLILLQPPFLKFVKQTIQDFFAVSVRIIIDGVPVSEPLYTESRLERLAHGKSLALENRGYSVGKSNSSGYVKDFIFRKIETLSDSDNISPERSNKEEAALTSVGSIVLEVYTHKKEDIDFKNEQVPRRVNLMSEDLAFDLSQPIHKTSLKNNVSHGVSLGPPQFYRHLGKASHLLNPNPEMLGAFIFKYRSLRFIELQQRFSNALSSSELIWRYENQGVDGQISHYGSDEGHEPYKETTVESHLVTDVAAYNKESHNIDIDIDVYGASAKTETLPTRILRPLSPANSLADITSSDDDDGCNAVEDFENTNAFAKNVPQMGKDADAAENPLEGTKTT